MCRRSQWGKMYMLRDRVEKIYNSMREVLAEDPAAA